MGMSATVGQLEALLLQLAPLELAEDWDNVGLLAGHPDREVERVLCALDLTPDVVAEAVERDCQLVVTHHPILFRGRKNLCETDAEGRMLCALVRANLSMIALHTNYDNAHPGVNDALAGRLGLQSVEALENGMRLGETDLGTLSALEARVSEALSAPVRRYGAPDAPVRRVAVLGGSGGGFAEQARQAGADCYVTGEISYHAGLDAAQNGLCVLEAGHGPTERPGILALSCALQRAADRVQYDIEVLDSRT